MISLDSDKRAVDACCNGNDSTLALSRLLKNYCASLIWACAVLGILMYSLCTFRFLRSGRAQLRPARYVIQHPASVLSR